MVPAPATCSTLSWKKRHSICNQASIAAVIQTPTGYHILLVAERDPNRLLEPDAMQALQGQALQKWLETRRSQSEIQVMLP